METIVSSNLSLRELLKCYKTISKIMEDNKLKMDNSFRRVQSYLSNIICNKLSEEELKFLE